MKKILVGIGSILKQVFVDQTGTVDDKRVGGVALLISGIIFVWTRKGPLAYLDYGQIVAGLACLGISLASDRYGNPNGPSAGGAP